MIWYHYDDGQFLFNQTLRRVGAVAKIFLFVLVFSPILFLAYAISTIYIDKHAEWYVWLGSIALVSLAIYQLLFILKGMIVGLRENGYGWWIWVPLFLLCSAFVCGLPVGIVLPWFQKLTHHQNALSWGLALLFGYFIYGQYNFLNTRLPFFPDPDY
jgi:hypothetical protein